MLNEVVELSTRTKTKLRIRYPDLDALNGHIDLMETHETYPLNVIQPSSILAQGVQLRNTPADLKCLFIVSMSREI